MKRTLLFAPVVLAVIAGGVVLSTAVQVRRQSILDEAQPADVILVLGAAEYSGRPSPVLKARLDHGLDLYRRRLAPRILTTGGAGGDPLFTEGGVGRAYLISHDVPEAAVIVEVEAETTAHSAAATGEIMRRLGLDSCIVVSDGYHIFRAKRMLQSQGFTVHGSPRPSLSKSDDWSLWRLYLRQSVGYWLWRVGLRI